MDPGAVVDVDPDGLVLADPLVPVDPGAVVEADPDVLEVVEPFADVDPDALVLADPLVPVAPGCVVAADPDVLVLAPEPSVGVASSLVELLAAPPPLVLPLLSSS